MRKLIIGAILSVTVTCGIFAYMEWDKRKFADSLPKPPVVEKNIDVHTHPHPQEHSHPHEVPAPETDLSVVDANSDSLAEENPVITATTPEDNTVSVDSAEQTLAAWQTNDAHEHQFSRSPFAEKLPDTGHQSPDERADIIMIGLIRQFGDTPEVQTYMNFKRKILKNEPLSLDERIAYTAAILHLWPDPETKKTLDIFLQKRATEYPRSTKIVR